jgi:hypothetical protein
VDGGDVEVRGELLVNNQMSVYLRTADGDEAWLPRDQIAIVYDVGGVVVVTLPKRLAKAKGIY